VKILAKKQEKKQEWKDRRICIYMTPEEKRRVDKFLLAVMTKKEQVIDNPRPMLLRKALNEWLDKHEKDLTALD
jgi:hypothetical protein